MKVGLISRGVEYDLSDGEAYRMLDIDGIAHAATSRLTERGPMQHGETDLGYRLQPRRILLALLARGGDEAAWLARREELMRILRASDRALALRLRSGDVVRQIDCYLTGEMSMAQEGGVMPRWQRVGLQLYCPDPTWYDPAPVTLEYSGGGGEGTMVPTPVPTFVGASDLDQTQVVHYAGTWESYPVIRIVGPIEDARIENTSTGEALDFAGTTIAAGHYYEIDCRYGRKSVTDDTGANRIADLAADSNLATFHIGAHPDVLNGINAIRASGLGVSSATRVRLTYYTRYVGV